MNTDIKEQQVRDFDAMWKEKDKATFSFRAFGRDYYLPVEIPAGVILRTLRVIRKHGSVQAAPEAEIIAIMADVLGYDNVDDLCERGATLEQLTDLFNFAVARYTGVGDEESPKQEPQGAESP